MSEPRLFDFALIKYEDPTTPGAYIQLCGIVGVQRSKTAETQSRRVRDCAKPNRPGVRRTRIIGVDWTVSGTGRTNGDQMEVIDTTLVGRRHNYRIEYYEDDGTDAGNLVGTDYGDDEGGPVRALMSTFNINVDSDSSTSDMEITLEGEGELVFSPEPAPVPEPEPEG